MTTTENRTPAGNSRFKQLRVLWEVDVHVSQKFLSLTENNQFRSSQLREAAERYHRVEPPTNFKQDVLC